MMKQMLITAIVMIALAAIAWILVDSFNDYHGNIAEQKRIGVPDAASAPQPAVE